MAITAKISMSVNAAFVPDPDGLLAGRRNRRAGGVEAFDGIIPERMMLVGTRTGKL